MGQYNKLIQDCDKVFQWIDVANNVDLLKTSERVLFLLYYKIQGAWLNKSFQDDVGAFIQQVLMAIQICQSIFECKPIEEVEDLIKVYQSLLIIRLNLFVYLGKGQEEDTIQALYEDAYEELVWNKLMLTRPVSYLNAEAKAHLLKEWKELQTCANQLEDPEKLKEDKIKLEQRFMRANLSVKEITNQKNNYIQETEQTVIKAIQEKLRPRELFIDFYSVEDTLICYIINTDQVHCQRINLPRRELQELINELLDSMFYVDFDSEPFENVSRKLRNRLTNKLFQDINLAEYEHLRVVADKWMAKLPFGALPYNDKYRCLDNVLPISLYTSTHAFLNHQPISLWHKNLEGENACLLAPVYSTQKQPGNSLGFTIKRILRDLKMTIHTGHKGDKSSLLSKIEKAKALYINADIEENFFRASEEPVIPLKKEAERSKDYLFLSDLNHFNFQQLDLVFLNCCNTAKGQNVITEGIPTINLGFLVNGATNLIYPLLRITKELANEFATRFFDLLLIYDSPSIALWKTKQWMMDADLSPKYSSKLINAFQIIVA